MTKGEDNSEYQFYLPLYYGLPFNDPIPSTLVELIKARMAYLFGECPRVACAAPVRGLPDGRVDVFRIKSQNRRAVYDFAHRAGRAVLHTTMELGLPNGHRLVIQIDCSDLFEH